MIGQNNLINQLNKLISKGTFPRFSILVGDKGSGKKTLLKRHIIPLFVRKGYTEYIASDVKMETIRTLIEMAYKYSNMIFVIPDTDNMSTQAKNALLKVTEECPHNNYFILTLQSLDGMLDTIKSRGVVFHMDVYTPDEIFEYAIDRYRSELQDKESRDIIRQLCRTPGDVNILYKSNILEFYDYVKLVADNIANVSLANSFKIPSKVALKDDDAGYDLKLFWRAFMRASFDVGRYTGVYITSKYLQKLRIKGINRQMLMDNWILEIRESWM